MEILKVSEERTKTASKNQSFHADYTNTSKGKVISKAFQKACLILSTKCKLFWITVQENNTGIIAFHCIKHRMCWFWFVFLGGWEGLIVEKRQKTHVKFF